MKMIKYNKKLENELIPYLMGLNHCFFTEYVQYMHPDTYDLICITLQCKNQFRTIINGNRQDVSNLTYGIKDGVVYKPIFTDCNDISELKSILYEQAGEIFEKSFLDGVKMASKMLPGGTICTYKEGKEFCKKLREKGNEFIQYNMSTYKARMNEDTTEILL